MTVRGAILAGGHATRYGGRPKGLERVGGERILDRVVESMTRVLGAAPILIANDPAAGTWRRGLRVAPDVRPDCGTLGGILTAVTAGEGPVLLTAWDMPFVPEALLEALVAGSAEHDVFLPASGSRRGVEPLCGVYGPACREPIDAALATEDYRAIAFHESVRVGTLPIETVRGFGDPETLFFNVNSEADLAEAETRWQTLV